MKAGGIFKRLVAEKVFMPKQIGRTSSLQYEPALVHYVNSLIGPFNRRERKNALRTYCMFIGYPRSGHSMVGSLIDAHPDAIVSHELDTLQFINIGFSRSRIFNLIFKNSAEFAAHGRTWAGYTLSVPGQHHGKTKDAKLIGDKKGGGSSMKLSGDPGLLDKLSEIIQLPIKFIHVVRNPFDNISTIAKKENLTLAAAAHLYFSLAKTNSQLLERIDQPDVLTLHHEQLIESPYSTIKGLCDFLGLQEKEDYLKAASAVVFKAPHQSRFEADWGEAEIASVADRLGKYDFLSQYSFELTGVSNGPE